jgi:uncharacterized protein involved in cysteine biosynthesis
VSESEAAPEAPFEPGALRQRPPSVLRRAAAGAWHILAGFAFLLRRPGLWPLAVLPAVLAVVGVAAGFLLGLFAIPWLEQTLLPEHSRVGFVMSILLTLALWLGSVAAGVLFGLGVALLLASPILERLSRRVEEQVRAERMEHAGGLKWEIAQSMRAALYFVLAAPGVLLLSLIPFVGPPLGMLWGAHALALQQTDLPLTRRGLTFSQRRAWHRRWRPESLGFGLAGLITLLVPFANVLIAPVLTVAGTLFVLELEEDLVPPDRPAPPADPAATSTEAAAAPPSTGA